MKRWAEKRRVPGSSPGTDENVEAVSVLGGVVRTSEHCRGTLERGTEPTDLVFAHLCSLPVKHSSVSS